MLSSATYQQESNVLINRRNDYETKYKFKYIHSCIRVSLGHCRGICSGLLLSGAETHSGQECGIGQKKQIIAALNIRDVNDNQVEVYYNKLVEADEIINEKNEVLSAGKPGGENDGFKLNGGDFKAGKLALFVCNVDGQKKYVMPVYGMGLWGGISGYIAINADKETIYGVYFNHEGETAGLGAEIKDNQKWQQQFCGKHLFADGNQDAVALSVCKKVDNPATQVDGVSGATLTCDGVTRMIHEGLGKYLVFLKDK